MISDKQPRPLIFQPSVVLLVSAALATLCGLRILQSAGLNSTAFQFSGSFFYVVPIVVPFVCFLFERAEHWCKGSLTRVICDTLVVGLAIGRVVANVPLISGHTVFLTYAIFTTRSRLVLVTAAIVMVQVVYLKYFVWHDFITSTAGIVLGSLAAFLVKHVELRIQCDLNEQPAIQYRLR